MIEMYEVVDYICLVTQRENERKEGAFSGRIGDAAGFGVAEMGSSL